MVEHIDKFRTQNDLRYRFDFLSKFIEFDQSDVNMLNTLAPIIFPLLPALVERLYKKLYSFDVTKRFFHMRNDGFETFPVNREVGITLDFVQTEYRKDMFSVYLKRVLTQGQWDDSFIEYLSRVGQMHTPKGGSSAINVEYMYMNALFCYLQQLLMEVIWSSDNLDHRKKQEAAHAISKFIYIQNDFLTMHYGSTWNKETSCPNIPIVKLTKCFFR